MGLALNRFKMPPPRAPPRKPPELPCGTAHPVRANPSLFAPYYELSPRRTPVRVRRKKRIPAGHTSTSSKDSAFSRFSP